MAGLKRLPNFKEDERLLPLLEKLNNKRAANTPQLKRWLKMRSFVKAFQ